MLASTILENTTVKYLEDTDNPVLEDSELRQVELIRDFLPQKESLIDPALPESMLSYIDRNSLEQAQADVAVIEDTKQRKKRTKMTYLFHFIFQAITAYLAEKIIIGCIPRAVSFSEPKIDSKLLRVYDRGILLYLILINRK